jgi:putative ABC transport system permease protein
VSEWRHRQAVERDQAEELQSHLDHLIDDHIRRGLAPAEARRQAQLELGGLDQARALARDARGFRPLEALAVDTRLALRQLRKTPAFTLAAVLTLTLGIGANTAIFSVVDAVMLRPLPYTDPARVVVLWEEISETLSGPGASGQPAEPQRIAVAPANYLDYKARVRAFESLAAYALLGRNLTGDGTPERLVVEEVTASYFQVLGVSPAQGRAILESDNTAGNERVAVISHSLWQRRYGAEPAIVGRMIQLNGQSHQVIGVMPADFTAPSTTQELDQVDAWLPIVFEGEMLTNRMEHIVSVIGRLAPGASLESAQRELASASDALGREFPQSETTRAFTDLLRRDQVTTVRQMLIVLLAAVGLVLLLACVNVAGLLMVRAVGRQREIAIRYALGASRARVLFEHLVQSLILAGLGGSAGLALGVGITRVLVQLAPATIPHIQTAGLDVRVVTFTAVVIVITALAFGIWPAWQASRTDPIDTLKAHDRPAAGGWVLKRRSGLLIAEVAVTTVVLVGAALMVRSLLTLNRVDLGFDPSNVVAASVVLPPETYPTPASRLQFFERLESRLRQEPGVRNVAFGNRLPLRGNWISGMVIDPAGAPQEGPPAMREAGFQAVNPTYFDTMGMALRAGRSLQPGDVAGSEAVGVVNETFGPRLLDGQNPIGRRIRRGPSMPAITIVGVVNDIRRTGRADEDGHRAADMEPQVYLAAAQTNLYPLPLRDVAVKVEPAALGTVQSAIERIVTELDPNQPITAARTLEATLALGSANTRFQTALFMVFGAVAFVLALVGIYGVVAYGVSQRAAEIALRMALGATRGHVLTTVVGRYAKLVALGVAAGLCVTYMASGLVADLLFEIEPTEPLMYTAVGILTVASGATAAGFAARRATRVDPMLTLK